MIDSNCDVGERIKLELNKVYNTECLMGMKQLPNNYIDLTITSPPYDDLRNYNGYYFDFESVAKELYRVTKDGGVVVWVVGDKTHKGSETGTSFKQALFFKEIGFNIHDTMIYEKDGQGACGSNYAYWQSFEYMFVLTKGKPKTVNRIRDKPNKYAGTKTHSNITKRMKDGSLKQLKQLEIQEFGIRTNIWRYGTGKGKSSKDEIAFQHPAIFPEQLAEDHIISWSNECDIVLDIFMGSGTTAKMAKINKRNWIGFEISEKYVEIANKRLELATV